MSRTTSDIPSGAATVSDLEQLVAGWLAENRFTVLDPCSDGGVVRIPHWDYPLVLHPGVGSLLAIQERLGGATIVFEVRFTETDGVPTIHIEGYVTSRGPGSFGAERDLNPNTLDVGAIPRNAGRALLSALAQRISRPSDLDRREALPSRPSVPLAPSPITADKGSRRKYSILAWVGIAMFTLGGIAGRFDSGLYLLAGLGLILVIVGGWGLLALAGREQALLRQPIPPQPTPVEPPSPELPAEPRLDEDVRFDLSGELARSRRADAPTMLLILGAGVAFIGSGGWLVATSLSRADAGGIGLGSVVGVAGAWFLVTLWQYFRRPKAMTIGPTGVLVELDPPRRVLLRWNDPKFGVAVTVIPREIGPVFDLPSDRPTFRLRSGGRTGVGAGVQVVTDIPQAAFDLLLLQGHARGLTASVTPLGATTPSPEYRMVTLSRSR